MAGCGCDSEAHLDRGDLLYQRKEARIVRRAGHTVELAAAAGGGHVCVVLPLTALFHAIVGGPVGQAVQVAPVLLPVGTELGVFLVPVGPPCSHGEPAGVAVFVLPSVCPANPIVIEHAEAADTRAVEGPPICYDRRHATTVSQLFDSRDQTKRVMRHLAPGS